MGKLRWLPKLEEIVSCVNVSTRQGQVRFLKVKWKYLEKIENNSDLERAVNMQKMNNLKVTEARSWKPHELRQPSEILEDL